MLGRILKFSLFINILFIFIAFFSRPTIIDASPVKATSDYLAESVQSKANNRRGGPLVKRSLHWTIDQPILIDSSSQPFRIRSRARRLKKKLHSSNLITLPNVFASAGLDRSDQSSKSLTSHVDNRLKRFRMLDPDEFQEMINSWNIQTPDEQVKEYNSMDSIGGMQLENYWSRK